jgi:hypothetical protein
MNKRKFISSLHGLVAILLGPAAWVQSYASEATMKKINIKRVAVGRFLIDLPEQAKLKALGASYWGFDITQLAGPKLSFSSFIKDKLSSLNKVGKNSQLQLVKENSGVNADSHIILYLEDPDRSRSLKLLGFKNEPSNNKIHQISTLVSQEKKEVSFEYASKLLSLIKPRISSEPMPSQGLVLDNSYIAAADLTAGEKVSAAFEFPDEVSFSLTTQVREPSTEAGLIERTKKALAIPELASTSQVLRMEKRTVVTFEGEEVIYKNLKGSPESVTHNFEWQFKGRNQISSPAMKLVMELRGDPNKPALLSDEDALNLWDLILKSIQIRTAV